MNQLQRLFEYQGQQVRTIVRDGEPWFVAKDVCVILEHSNPSKAIKDLVDEDDLTSGYPIVDSLGRTQHVTLVNESGLYSLILGSRKPEARAFKRWVTHEVLPSIRKTGQYSLEQPKSPAELMLMAAQQLVEHEKKLKELEERTEAAHHRIDNLDKIDIIGDPQQRLNAMVRKYAVSRGLTFRQAWKDFRTAFNTAYRTNLTMLIENYKLKHGIKDLSMPEYLARVGRLDDAIRVADKLLNQAS